MIKATLKDEYCDKWFKIIEPVLTFNAENNIICRKYLSNIIFNNNLTIKQLKT